MQYIDLDISDFSIFRAPLWWLEMPYIDLDISPLSSTRAPIVLGVQGSVSVSPGNNGEKLPIKIHLAKSMILLCLGTISSTWCLLGPTTVAPRPEDLGALWTGSSKPPTLLHTGSQWTGGCHLWSPDFTLHFSEVGICRFSQCNVFSYLVICPSSNRFGSARPPTLGRLSLILTSLITIVIAEQPMASLGPLNILVSLIS